MTEAARVELQITQEVDLATEPEIRAAVEEAARRRPHQIVLDFCSSKFVGAPAIRLALTALDRVSHRGGTVIVRGRRSVHRIFRITETPEQIELEDCP